MNQNERPTSPNFGSTSLRPSPVGVGCSRIGGMSRAAPDEIAMLRQALDVGINFFDTADKYRQGNSERILGEALRGRRQEAIICTKAGITLGSAQRLPSGVLTLLRKIGRSIGPVRRSLKAGVRSFSGTCFDGTYLTQAIERSLRRLRTDYVDIFLLHNPPLNVLNSLDLPEVLCGLRDRGMVRYFGVACPDGITEEYIRTSLRFPGLSVVEMPIHPYVGKSFFNVVDAMRDKGVAVIGRTPYASGKLLGDKRFLKIATSDPAKRTPAQMALRFAIQLNELGIVLPGVSSVAHLNDTLGGLSGPALSPSAFGRICALGAGGDR